MKNASLLLLLLVGCGLVELPPEPNCEDRTAAWPDEDGDGVGDATAVYVGCDVPEGWVQVPPAGDDTGADTADSGDSADTGDTGTR